ncbi:MAG: lyase family protein [Candidatus Delongbacteria bacterium]|jgi:aspartate ammonia-lyase|nr:lyase family protein [Candidatus Delongbacteria bacterium]
MMRKEKDIIGEKKIPAEALYGINALRACENFPNDTRFNVRWYKAMGTVKQALYLTIQRYQAELQQQYPELKTLQKISDEHLQAMIKAASEIGQGKHTDHFIVPAIQGGAGTSINMNINEIISNRALQLLNHNLGSYSIIDPFESANLFQSTNDVVPTALKMAVMMALNELEEKINALRFSIEKQETSHRDSLRISYTQMQAAVPSSFGKLFSAYNDALSRDWWRVSKCFERIKQANLGGSAIGTGITVPRYVIMEAIRELQKLTDLPLTRGENLVDTTSNLDNWTEIHATLKAHAVNLEKISNDLRLLASDVSDGKSLSLPQKQVGSSVMPGKVNPVIPEYIISIAHQVYANDQQISALCGQSLLELNAYIPSIGHAVLNTLDLLISACDTMKTNMIEGMKVNAENAYHQLINNSSVTTAFVPFIGYHKSAEIAKIMKKEQSDVFAAAEISGYINKKQVEEIIKPENLLKLGFSVKDFINFNQND